MNEIFDSIDNMSWDQCLEKLFDESRPGDARSEYASLLFLEARASWKYLTDLSNAENALDLSCGTGIVSLNLCRSFKNVYVLDKSLDQLKLAKKMSEAKGFKNLTPVHGGNAQNLPFPSKFFDLVCVNGALEQAPSDCKDDRADIKGPHIQGSDVIAEPWSDSNFLKIQIGNLNEINRILKPNGTLYLAAGNSLNYHYLLKTPRVYAKLLYAALISKFFAKMNSLSAAGDSHKSHALSFFSLKRILEDRGFKQIDVYSLRPDFRLFYEIIFFDTGRARQIQGGSIKERIKERLYRSRFFCPSFGIIASKDKGKNNFIQSILKLIVKENMGSYEVNKCYVMKKGNVVLDIVGVNDQTRGLIVKIPVDDVSESQNERNYTMLSNMQNNALIPQAVKGLIPRPFGRHTVNGQKIYIEEKFSGLQAGRAVRDEQAKDMVIRNAFDFIVVLHQATLRKVTWSDGDYCNIIGSLIERVRRVGKNGHRAFAKIDKMLRDKFVDHEISVAQRHGDFSFANILIDPKNHGILGIIDWDNSEYDHPLLIDLINLIESTYNYKNLELGYTITDVLLKDKLSGEEKASVKRYLSTFGYAEDLVFPYTILYWLYHFDSQIKYNFLLYNPRWMTENYYNVITVIDKML